MMKTTKAASVLLFFLLGLASANAQDKFYAKGSYLAGNPPWLWGVDAESVEKWQSYLGDADATGSFTLPGFNISQPWSNAEPLDWTIKMAVKANMSRPDGAGGKVVTGGTVWIEPPDGLVNGDNFTANEEWVPASHYYISLGVSVPNSKEPLTPFFHRDPNDDSPPDGTCKGILPHDCIWYLESSGEALFLDKNDRQHVIQNKERCPGIGATSRFNMGSPFNLTKRGQDGAAMEYNEGWLASFISGAHAEGNETDYAAHGSQYVPILFQWMRANDTGHRYKEPKPQGPVASLMCLAVDEAAKGKKLPDPGKDYLKAVKDKEAGSGGQRSNLVLAVILAGLGIGLLGVE